MFNFNFLIILLDNLHNSMAAHSSRRGMYNAFKGATRDLAAINRTSTSPVE